MKTHVTQAPARIQRTAFWTGYILGFVTGGLAAGLLLPELLAIAGGAA